MKRLVALVVVGFLLLTNAPAYAGHILLSATMTWKRTGNPGEVEFEIKVGVGLEDWFAQGPIGTFQSIPEGPITLDFGDGSSPLNLSYARGRVIAYDGTENWTLFRVDRLEGPILHTYPLTGTYTAVAEVSCHPHQYLLNRGGEIVRLESKVDLSLSRPPSIDVPPLVVVHPTATGTAEFRVPYGQVAPMTAGLRGATDTEAGSCCNPSMAVNTPFGPDPPDPSYYIGYVALETATPGSYWTAQLVAQNADGLKTATDFTIRVGPPLASQSYPGKVVFYKDNLVDQVDMIMPNGPYVPIRLMPGEPMVAFLAGMNHQEDEDWIELTCAGYPDGATTANAAVPSPPVPYGITSTFTWVPSRADVRSHAFNFIVTAGDESVSYQNRLPIVVNVLDPRLISGGYTHAVGVRESDSAVLTWGNNDSGCLGRGPIGAQSTPGAVAGITGPIRAVEGGQYFTVVLKENGAVWAFGRNLSGELGQGDSETRTSIDTPVQVKDPTDPTGFLQNIIAISANGAFTLAVKGNGTVWAWGSNASGQLGDGTQTNRKQPVQVKNSDGSGFLQNIISAKAGRFHSLALTRAGEVLSWGLNSSGQLGDGSTTLRTLPVSPVYCSLEQITPVITAIDAGLYHSIAVNSHLGGGLVLTWGNNNYGQLGNGTTGGFSTCPIVLSLSNVVKVSSKYLHSLALKRDGTIVAWGFNGYGQLGNTGAGGTSNIPVPVMNLANVVNIGTGSYYSFAAKSDGTGWAWGQNNYGQLGAGTSGGNVSLPTAITGGAQF